MTLDEKIAQAQAHFKQGQWAAAIVLFRSISEKSLQSGHYIQWILCHFQMGQKGQGQQILNRALKQYPAALDLKHLEFKIYVKDDKIRAARAAFYLLEQEGDSNDYSLYALAGQYMMGKGNFEQAKIYLNKAKAIAPSAGDILNNLGIIALTVGEFKEAQAQFEAVLTSRGREVAVCINLAKTYMCAGLYEKAEMLLRQMLIEQPNDVYCHIQLAFALLWQGKYQEGWKEYEWRWQVPEFIQSNPRPQKAPAWQGESLKSCSLLIYAEQGFGDVIQFARYVLKCTEQADHVYFLVSQPLKDVFSSFKNVQIVASTEEINEVTYECALMSLPYLLGERQALSCPSYISVQPSKQLSQEKLNVGYVWQGNVEVFGNPPRRLEYALLKKLFTVQNAAFFRLTKERMSEEEAAYTPEHIHNIGPDFKNFYDTAQAIAGLDIVVSIDTGVAHLAAAMGKPVCLILNEQGDWRWLSGRDDSPWYPHVKLYGYKKHTRSEAVDTIVSYLSDKAAFRECPSH